MNSEKRSQLFAFLAMIGLALTIWLLTFPSAQAQHYHGYTIPDTVLGSFAVDSVYTERWYHGTRDSTWVTICTTSVDSYYWDSIPQDSTKGIDIHQFIAYAGFTGYEPWRSFYLPPLTVSAVATIDSTTIAGYIWNTPAGNHVVANSFGYMLDVPISGISTPTGSGFYARTILAYDSIQEADIGGLRVSVRTESQSLLSAYGTTGGDGTISVNLGDSAASWSYVVSIGSPGYQFTPDTIHVTGEGTDTIWGTWYSPEAPTGDSTCLVYGWFYDVAGNPTYAGREVTLTLPGLTADTCNDRTLIDLRGIDEVDADGLFEIEVIYSECLGGRKYIMAIEGVSTTKQVTVPSTETYLFNWND